MFRTVLAAIAVAGAILMRRRRRASSEVEKEEGKCWAMVPYTPRRCLEEEIPSSKKPTILAAISTVLANGGSRVFLYANGRVRVQLLGDCHVLIVWPSSGQVTHCFEGDFEVSSPHEAILAFFTEDIIRAIHTVDVVHLTRCATSFSHLQYLMEDHCSSWIGVPTSCFIPDISGISQVYGSQHSGDL